MTGFGMIERNKSNERYRFKESIVSKHIFISYSSKDTKAAQRVCSLLEEKGKKCFIAPRDIRTGCEYAEEIINGIDDAGVMVLLMSEHANQSPHVLREVERAVSKSIPILVYKMDDVQLSKSMEYFLMTHQWLNAESDPNMEKILEFVQKVECKNDQEPEKVAEEKNLENTNPVKVPAIRKWLLPVVVIAAIFVLLGGIFYIKSQTPKHKVAVGDTITFGTYNDEAIEWRVLRISEDGKQAVLISKYILTMKAFDAAESGKFNSDGTNDYWAEESAADTDLEIQVLARGNSDWSTSNIRTWLNSANEVVTYTGQAPVVTAMAEKKNGYNNESGFLYNFTEEERNAIIPTENTTAGNALSAESKIITTDLVYFLSVDELAWFDEAGMSKLTHPTEAAVAQDKTNWYVIDNNEFEIEEYCWWLRTPVSGTSSQCYMVGNGFTEENLWERNVGLEGYGIRPAVTVDLSSDALQFENE